MKIVRLNGRYRQYRDHRHTVALRFDSWTDQAARIEILCRNRLGSGGWVPSSHWYSYYGHRPDTNSPRPYWITFRYEPDLTLILLSANTG
jgi:hypothetical protein